MLTLEEIFPPFALRLTCGSLELRVLRDDDFPELVELVRGGIQPPDSPMPFPFDWHLQPYEPGMPDAFPASSLSRWWAQRATCKPDDWRFTFAVRHHGILVGIQDMHAQDFPLLRSVTTDSWLSLRHQGKGIGTMMRQMVVAFAFDQLDARICESGYLTGNDRSAAVSRKVGYVDNGSRPFIQTTQEGKVSSEEHLVRVTPQNFVRPPEPVNVNGAEAMRKFLNLDDS